METYIALLRGINVGGHKKIKMIELRTHLLAIELADVQTYIQSGNIVFKSEIKDVHKLEHIIHLKILKEYGFEVPVIVLTIDNLESAILNNPFKEMELDKLCFTFLDEVPLTENLDQLNALDYSPEKFEVKAQTIFIYFPNGFGRAKLSNNLFENKLKVRATSRNWNTVNKLIEMSKNNSV